jgi:hypothetical protein
MASNDPGARCGRCGEELNGSPDLEELAARVDGELAMEFHRPVSRLDWAGGPPDGLLDNVLAWMPSVRIRRDVWRKGQATWVELVTTATCNVCPTCPERAGQPVAMAESLPSLEPEPPLPVASAPAPETWVLARPADPAPALAPAPTDSSTIMIPISTAAAAAAPTPADSRPAAFVVIRSGPSAGTRIAVAGSLATIGRGSSCTVTIPDTAVAFRQARLIRDGTQWRVEPVAGTPGVTLNGAPVATSAPLGHGDSLVIGPCQLQFELLPDG